MNLIDWMDDPIPREQMLCHYTDYCAALNHILPERALKFSSLRKTHDPLEFEDFSYGAGSVAAGDRAVVLESMDRGLQLGTEEQQIVKGKAKIGCFTIDATDISGELHHKACYRCRMWSQYAKAHTGVCLVFDRNRLISVLRGQVGDAYTFLQQRIFYSNDLGELQRRVFIQPKDTVYTAKERVLKNADWYFFTKLADFRDENELRICYWREATDADSDCEILSVGDALAGVLLGNSFPQEYRPTAINEARKLGVPVLQILWLHGTPFWVEVT